jgi:hypothetical protein
MDYASTSAENQNLAKALDDRIGELSAVAHAALAQVAKASAEFEAIGGWAGGGIRHFPHWLTKVLIRDRRRACDPASASRSGGS